MNRMPSSADLQTSSVLSAVCPTIAGHEPGAIGLDELAFAQDAERAVNFAERARDLRLADARRAGEHHVPADGTDGQTLLAPHLLDFEAGEKLVDLFLHGAETDHGAEIVERLIGGTHLRNARLHVEAPPGGVGRPRGLAIATDPCAFPLC